MKRILLFDKELSQLNEIKKMLERENFEVITSSSPSETEIILRNGDFSLMVINIEALFEDENFDRELIRKYHEDTKTPVIFILSDLESDFSPLKYEFEVEDVILKPYREEELLVRVINQLNRVKNGSFESIKLERLNILLKIGNLPHQSMNIDEISTEILNIISNAFKCESAAIFLKDDEEQPHLVGFLGLVEESDLLKLTQFSTKKVVETGQELAFPDLTREIFWHRLKLSKPEYLKNAVCIPVVANEMVVGSIELFNVPGNLFSKSNGDNFEFLHQVVNEAAKVISLSKQFVQVNRDLEFAIDELSILYEISDALSSTLNLEELLRLIVRNALRSFNAKVVSLMMLNRETQELSIRFAEGLSRDIIKNTRLKMGEGIAGRVAKTGQPLLLVDVMGIDSIDVVDKSIKSALSVPLKMRDEVVGVLNVSKTSKYQFTETDLKLLFNLASLAAQAIEKAALYQDIKDSLDEIKSSYMSTVKALSRAIEAKDPYTRGHVDRVAKYGLAIALELDSELLKDDMFRYALVLHDIGKIEIPDQILTKPGVLTEEEMAIMKRHPEVGAQILSPVKFLKEAAEMVRYHQERYDGKGYPKGLKGEEIPMAARVIAVADSFDAIISERPYRRASTIKGARNEILKNAGSQFDPGVVSAFISALDKQVIP